MRPLLKVTRETVAGIPTAYLYFREKPAAATTVELANERVCVDLDAQGTTVGIELVGPSTADLGMMFAYAEEHDLSLDGLFS